MAYVRKTKRAGTGADGADDGEQPLFDHETEGGTMEQMENENAAPVPAQEEAAVNCEPSQTPPQENQGYDGGDRPQSRVVVRSRQRVERGGRERYDDGDRQQRGGHQSRRGGGGYERQGGGGHYGGGGGAYNNNAYASGINQAGMSSGFNLNSVSYAQGPLPELPKLSSMPDLYGRPEPRGDDGGVTRLSINELTRMSMIDLRE
ncbi:MAG: hypothetical protein LBC77_00895, partial [Spirochaetaceae bacterium]|nr:hypothetical protein [Spirochaetaceae bacterium]